MNNVQKNNLYVCTHFDRTVSIKRDAMYVGAMFRFKGAAGGWRNFVMSLVHFWLGF